MCHFANDFGLILLEHNFFTTGHGKNNPDGVGARAKQDARKASLQGAMILDAKQMHEYLSKKDSNIM